MSTESGNTTEEQLALLQDRWHGRASLIQNAHYESGNYYETKYLRLGIIVVVLSAFTGGIEVIVPIEYLQQLGVEPSLGKSFSGLISLLVAILAGLQTFLKFSQRAERHRVAGAKYGDIKRSLEELSIVTSESIEKGKAGLHKIKKHMDTLSSESPELPSKIIKKYKKDGF